MGQDPLPSEEPGLSELNKKGSPGRLQTLRLIGMFRSWGFWVWGF